MKVYLIILILFGLTFCGHIYVSDTQLHSQNTVHYYNFQCFSLGILEFSLTLFQIRK